MVWYGGAGVGLSPSLPVAPAARGPPPDSPRGPKQQAGEFKIGDGERVSIAPSRKNTGGAGVALGAPWAQEKDVVGVLKDSCVLCPRSSRSSFETGIEGTGRREKAGDGGQRYCDSRFPAARLQSGGLKREGSRSSGGASLSAVRGPGRSGMAWGEGPAESTRGAPGTAGKRGCASPGRKRPPLHPPPPAERLPGP